MLAWMGMGMGMRPLIAWDAAAMGMMPALMTALKDGCYICLGILF
jgi:hypothetical protein